MSSKDIKKFEIISTYSDKYDNRMKYRVEFVTDNKYFVKCNLYIYKDDGFLDSYTEPQKYTSTVTLKYDDLFNLLEGQRLSLLRCFSKYYTYRTYQMQLYHENFNRHFEMVIKGVDHKIEKATKKHENK